MSNLPGNPHAELAEADIEYQGAWNELEAVTALLQTSARATMALAYEQRTASLIALAVAEREPFNPDYDMETIYKRLGLGN